MGNKPPILPRCRPDGHQSRRRPRRDRGRQVASQGMRGAYSLYHRIHGPRHRRAQCTNKSRRHQCSPSLSMVVALPTPWRRLLTTELAANGRCQHITLHHDWRGGTCSSGMLRQHEAAPSCVQAASDRGISFGRRVQRECVCHLQN